MEKSKLSKYQLLAIQKIQKSQLNQSKTKVVREKSVKKIKKIETHFFPATPVQFYGSHRPAEALPRSSELNKILQKARSPQYQTITFDEYLHQDERISANKCEVGRRNYQTAQ